MARAAVVSILVLGCSKAPTTDPVAAQVPADTALVVTLSLDRLRLSTYWPQVESAVGSKLPLEAARRSCPTDPVHAVDSIALALPADVRPERALVFVRGVDRKLVDACATSFLASEGQPPTIAAEGKLVAYRQGQGQGQGEDALHAMWLDRTTIAFAPGALMVKEALAGFDKPIAHDPLFEEMLRGLRRDRVASFAFRAPPQSALRGYLAPLGGEPEAGRGWIELDTTLRAEVVLRFADRETAAHVAKQPFIGPLAKVRTIARGNDVVLTLALDADETKQMMGDLVDAAR